MDYDLTECQRRNVDAIVRNGGLEFPEPFKIYTSGEIGPYYIQSVAVTGNGEDYSYAVDSIKGLIERYIDYEYGSIAGGDSRDWDFSNPVAVALKKAHAKLYKTGKILGADMSGKNVILVCDLNNMGSSVRDQWVPAITGSGGKIKDVFFYIDRVDKGVQVLKDLGLKSHSVVKFDAVTWDYLYETDKITDNTYSVLMDRIGHEDGWAEDMLLSQKGLQKMSELLNSIDDSVKTKAENVLDVGYPQLKYKILEGIIHL